MKISCKYCNGCKVKNFKTKAKNTGILRIQGTLDGMTFYKTLDGQLVKTKSGLNKDRIANDAAFASIRENGAEFGSAVTAGKVMRNTFRIMLQTPSDDRVRFSILSGQLFDVSNLQ